MFIVWRNIYTMADAGGGATNEEGPVREQDKYLPTANIARIMKKVCLVVPVLGKNVGLLVCVTETDVFLMDCCEWIYLVGKKRLCRRMLRWRKMVRIRCRNVCQSL